MKDSFDADYVFTKLNSSIIQSKRAAESYSMALDSLYKLIQKKGCTDYSLYKEEPMKAGLKLSSSILSLQMLKEIQNKKVFLLRSSLDRIKLQEGKR